MGKGEDIRTAPWAELEERNKKSLHNVCASCRWSASSPALVKGQYRTSITIFQSENSLFYTNAGLNACIYSHKLLPSWQFITFLNNISNILLLLLLLSGFVNKKIPAGKRKLCDKTHQCMLFDGVAPCYRHKWTIFVLILNNKSA